MTPDELVQAKSRDWERLSNLLARVERGRLSQLDEAEIVEFGQLYRATTSDLALAQRDFPQHQVTLYLNQLAGRAHPVLYRGEPLVARRIRHFYGRQYPQLYRKVAPFILAAALLFLGTGLVFYFVTLANPAAADVVLPPGLVRFIKNGTLWFKDSHIGASFLMTNNLRVSFLAYAGGMLLGLFTIYMLVINGLELGGVLALMQVYGHAPAMWEFVIGHGVLELSEITMAGGSGLMLAYAVLQPGLLTRRDALTVAAQQGVRLLLGSAPLLVAAGLIEGFLSPSEAPAGIKYAVGITSGVLLYGYLLLVGRKGRQEE